jgi:uncharacterized membrane protein
VNSRQHVGLLYFVLAVCAIFALPPKAAAGARSAPDSPRSFSIKAVLAFNYPSGAYTAYPGKINDRGDIGGYLIFAGNGDYYGFARYANGDFTLPQQYPSSNFTYGEGIDNRRMIVGAWWDGSTYHSFSEKNGKFVNFDLTLPGVLGNYTYGDNQRGDIVGGYNIQINPSTVGTQAFAVLKGQQETIQVPGALGAVAIGINDHDQIVGAYSTTNYAIDTESGADNALGYMVQKNGQIVESLSYPGATTTVLEAINNQGLTVGRWFDANNVPHGLLYDSRKTKQWLTYDYPQSTSTVLNGINNAGLISGRWTDANGLIHGLIARVRVQH